MSSKEQTHGNDKASSKHHSAKPATENLAVPARPHTHPATLIQRVKLDPRSLSPHDLLQLQRTVGNRAVRQLLANVAQRQEEPNQENKTSRLAPLNFPATLKTINHSAATGVVQRKITREPKIEEKTKNLADVPIGWQTYADTPTIINGKEFPPTKNAEYVLNLPFYEIIKKPSEVDQKDERWVLQKIRAAEQKVGYRMILPYDPPWIKETSWEEACAFIADALGGVSTQEFEQRMLNKFKRKLDKVKVEFKGRPTDYFFVEMVKHHEEHHVAEQNESIATILKPWDDKINHLEKDGLTIEGKDPRDAEENFYKTIGGRIEDIGVRFVEDIKRRGLEFHETGLGKAGGLQQVDFDVERHTIKLFYSHVSAMIIDYQLRKGYFFPGFRG